MLTVPLIDKQNHTIKRQSYDYADKNWIVNRRSKSNIQVGFHRHNVR